MSTPITWNGASYSIVAVGERTWGANVSSYLIAIAAGALSKAGGSFILTADVDFGTNFGLISKYYKSNSSNIAQSGIARFANNEGLGFRNAANSADLLLKVNASNVLEYGGNAVPTVADDLSVFAATTSAQLKSKMTDETGGGSLVFATSPVLVTPVIGEATATSVNKVAITAPAASATLTIANLKTLTVSNTLTFSGTDASSVAFGAGGTVAYLLSPSFTTPTLGVASATSINKVVLTAPATASTLTIADGKTLTASNTLTLTGTDASSVAFGAGGTVAYTANKLSTFAATTSAELKTVISDESGSGALIFADSPTFTTTVNFPSGSVTVPGMAFSADADGSGTGFYRSAANTIGIATNGLVAGQIFFNASWRIGYTGAPGGSLEHQIYTTSSSDFGVTVLHENATAVASSGIMAAQFTGVANCTGGYFYACKNQAGTTIGRIEGTGTGETTSFTGTSDARLKEDAKDFDGTSLVMAMTPHDFQWKNSSVRQRGFYAQELYEVLPEAVSVGDNSLTDCGTHLKNPWGIDYGKLTPVLVKAVQEQQATIEQLTQRINALENV